MSGMMSSLTTTSQSPLNGGMGIVSGLRGVTAVNRASRDQQAGQVAAQNELNPYMETGKNANTMLNNQLSNGQLGGNFTPGDLTKEPGYQFDLQQGQQALDRKASAPGGGGYFSGQALKDATSFGHGLADKTYNDAYNRWLQQQQNTYGMLSGQSAQGLDAAKQWGQNSANIGDIQANSVIAKENARMGMLNSFGNVLKGK